MNPTPPDRALIYGDDSSKAEQFYVYGSLLLNERRLAKIESDLLKALNGYEHEIKWNEARNLDDNVAFVEALFRSWSSLSYRCIVVPNTQIKKAVPGKQRPLLRAKLVFTHLNTYIKSTLLQQPRFFTTLDKDEFDPDVQEITLNRAFWRDHGGERTFDAFEKVRGEHSHDHLMLQAADLITGAIGWVSNGGLNTGSKAFTHRHALASLIARRARLPSLVVNGEQIPQGDVRLLGHQTQQWNSKGFQIWHMDLARSKTANWQ